MRDDGDQILGPRLPKSVLRRAIAERLAGRPWPPQLADKASAETAYVCNRLMELIPSVLPDVPIKQNYGDRVYMYESFGIFLEVKFTYTKRGDKNGAKLVVRLRPGEATLKTIFGKYGWDWDKILKFIVEQHDKNLEKYREATRVTEMRTERQAWARGLKERGLVPTGIEVGADYHEESFVISLANKTREEVLKILDQLRKLDI